MIDVGGAGGTVKIPGSISVKNFQWPETYAVGVAYQVNDQTSLMADYKHIGWAGVMKDFHMVFNPDGIPGGYIDATLYQKWEDQNVFEFGGAYKMNDALTLRAGLNLANNPVPDKYMNPLFPAIAKNHVTLGVGYVVSKASSVDFSYVYVPKVTATSGQGVTVDFGGFSSQLMYSYRY
jgi:long-chain fatty acid transport protein